MWLPHHTQSLAGDPGTAGQLAVRLVDAQPGIWEATQPLILVSRGRYIQPCELSSQHLAVSLA